LRWSSALRISIYSRSENQQQFIARSGRRVWQIPWCSGAATQSTIRQGGGFDETPASMVK
jgi:hypothetical protein